MTIQADTYAGFELVAGLRREVTALVRRQINVIASATGEAQQERWLDRLGELANMVEADTFKVIMLGQFSRGKSTVVNALLGQKVLPSYATETTAVINAVKFGQHPQAVLYPRPTPDDTHPKPVGSKRTSASMMVTSRQGGSTLTSVRTSTGPSSYAATAWSLSTPPVSTR